jgi:GNAT superfamily N-acetyltransferase
VQGSIEVSDRKGNVVDSEDRHILRYLTRGGANVAQIEAVFVSPASRGKGIGAEMMRFALAEARRFGCVRAQLTSQKRRTRAHSFYESLGFERTHEGMKLKL